MTSNPIYFLGLDGGGTGSRARLVDAGGRVLGEGSAGPATLRLGADASWAALMMAAAAALAAVDVDTSVVHTGIGLAGFSRRDAAAALIAKPHAFASLTIVGDQVAACVGAHGGADGGIVIVGTGSNGFGMVDGREVQVGGHGFPVSDEGSGARIGLAALQLALHAHDGRIPHTPLLQAVLQRFDGDLSALLVWMDRATATDYAALAPLVISHAAATDRPADPSAVALLQQAADDIAAMSATLFSRGMPRLALLGGLAATLEPWLPPDLRQRLVAPAGDALDGAILLARRAVVG